LSTPAQIEQILDGVSRATNKLILDEPFYGHYFVGLVKEVHEKVQTMAVGSSDSQIKLHINPGFWSQRLTHEPLRVGLLKHEILHVVLKHIFRAKDYKHKPLFNIACDLVVNQYIREGALPQDRLHLGLFPELNLATEMDAGYYYQKLLPAFERLQDRQNGAGMEGEPVQNAPLDPTEARLKDILGDQDEWLEKHGGWEEIERLPSTLRELLEHNVTEAVRQALEKAMHDKRWSQLPAGLRRSLEEVAKVERSVLNWRRMLRLFAESSSKTYLRNTIRRPSKRFGTTPGLKVKQKQRILLAIDTSGSVSQAELSIFFQEIYHIWKRGAEITVVECDSAIQNSYPYKGTTPKAVKGGGGTDFNPVISFGNSIQRPDALIYFTDGHARPPIVPPRYPILWVVSPQGIAVDSDPWNALLGRKVKIVL
jgi:predicted metal-dependent peptidase